MPEMQSFLYLYKLFSHSLWCPAVNNLKTVALHFLYYFIYYAYCDDAEELQPRTG